MAQNKFKKVASPNKGRSSRGKRRMGGAPLFGSLHISAFYVFKNIDFIFYLAFLGIIYIANSHYAVKTIKEIKEIQAELEKVSWESNARKSELMFESMQSRVAEKVEHLGLKPLQGKPRKIEVVIED
jgi:hypothetical protein